MAAFIKAGRASVNLDQVTQITFQKHRGELEVTIHFGPNTTLLTGEDAKTLHALLRKELGQDNVPSMDEVDEKPVLRDGAW